ncbi:MAG: hypothetical protein WCC64_22970 [Aliidongia sp.]
MAAPPQHPDHGFGLVDVLDCRRIGDFEHDFALVRREFGNERHQASKEAAALDRSARHIERPDMVDPSPTGRA